MCPDSFKFKQQGIGLPATIFIIVILAMIVLAMSDLNESSSRAFVQDYQSQRAFYAAESGAQVALNRIFQPGGSCGASPINFTSNGLTNCRADLVCTRDDVGLVTYHTVTSTGTCGSGDDMAQREIQVRARSQ
jgi:MSHA biogenesis protein MshP